VIEGLPFLTPVSLSNYVYLKLTDGAICWRTSTPGPPHLGDYVLFGSCSDGTGYWTRFVTEDASSDNSSPYGGYRRAGTLAGQNGNNNFWPAGHQVRRRGLPIADGQVVRPPKLGGSFR
jgi:hypothetical protein